uniref:Uncharacterized protein n=1 Tax=Glossina brevipalpis TaxID=37001 RepID=A0A1A9WBK2_9MUSC
MSVEADSAALCKEEIILKTKQQIRRISKRRVKNELVIESHLILYKILLNLFIEFYLFLSPGKPSLLLIGCSVFLQDNHLNPVTASHTITNKLYLFGTLLCDYKM